MKKQVIFSLLALSKKYPLKEFKPFIESVRKIDFEGDFVIFVNNLNENAERYFKSKGVKVVKFDFQYPYLKNNKIILEKFKHFKNQKINIFHFREFFPYIYLLENKDKYDSVAIADSADVIFQRNPFGKDFDKTKIYFSLQDNKIKDSPKDSEWIKGIYGQKELEKIWNNQICCTGTLFGGTKPMLDFLRLFVGEFKGNTIEQGNINYLIHNNKIKNAVVLNNQQGIMLTCSEAKKSNFILGKDKKIRSKSGKIYTMIHQYDTFPKWSFVIRGVCKRSLREYIKRLPFIGDLFVRLKALFVKSKVHLDKEEPPKLPSPTSQEKSF